MAITDAERHRLHTKLDQVLGEEDAAVLISHLPPSGWSDVARTRDLDHLEDRLSNRIDRLEERMDHRFAAVDARFDALEARFDARFEAIDARFEAQDAKFDAQLERSMREQTNRFLLYAGALVTVATTVQAMITRAVGG